MDNKPFIRYELTDGSVVGLLKREVHNAALSASFSLKRVGIIDIIVAELASNVVKHAAGRAEFLYRFSKENRVVVFEIICLDAGPGMGDVSHSMKDGVTTTKTLGNGLGALKRLSHTFNVYSILKWGTVCYSKIYAEHQAPTVDSTDVRFSALNVSKRGQTVSGDGYEVKVTKDYTNIFVGDGLGHGVEANTAVQVALSNFRICSGGDPAGTLEFIHSFVKKTRGLVATAVTIDHRLKKWLICGIGNVATRLCEGLASKNYISYNGIIGLRIPGRFQSHEADFNTHQCLVISTDGVTKHWALSKFPFILRYDPMMLAAVIYKECARGNDDVSILVVRT